MALTGADNEVTPLERLRLAERDVLTVAELIAVNRRRGQLTPADLDALESAHLGLTDVRHAYYEGTLLPIRVTLT